MAEVWRGRRTALGACKTVAVKLLAPHLADHAHYRAMFVEEARLSMLLNHANIVQAFDVGEDHGECYLAMEWVDGANLAELQAALWDHGRVLPLGVALHITAELLRALDYAHGVTHERAAGVVHRDVSPANVMLSRAGEVKLTDFGVARFANEETSGVHVKGKLRYMAPEQLQGESRTGAVDLYSVGAILHEMLAGEKFRGDRVDEAQLIAMVCDGVVPDLPAHRPVPQAVDAVRRSLLDPHVGRRPSDAREALRRVSACPGFRHAGLDLTALVGWRCELAPPARASASSSAGSARASSPARPAHSARPARPAGSTARGFAASSSTRAARVAQAWITARAAALGRVARIAAAVGLGVTGAALGCLGLGASIGTTSASAGSLRAAGRAPTLALARQVTAVRELAADGDRISACVAGSCRTVEQSNRAGPVSSCSRALGCTPAGGSLAWAFEPGHSVDPRAHPSPARGRLTRSAERLGATVTTFAARSWAARSWAAFATPALTRPSTPSPRRHVPAQVDPVEVRFAAGSFRFAYVKVAGKRLLIEPSAKLELEPGNHRVQVRFSADEPWVDFGRVRVRPKRPLVVKLAAPSELVIEDQP